MDRSRDAVFRIVGRMSAAEFESPFTGASEITRDTEQPLEVSGEFSETELPFATPFTPETESGDGRAEVTAEVLAELGTPELYEALAELAQEASEIHAERLGLGAGESFGSSAQLAELAVREHFEPLAEAAERMLETMAAEAGDREVGAISEAELTQLLETFEAMETPATESPAFEQLFGALKRLAGRAVKAAVGLAKKGFSAWAGCCRSTRSCASCSGWCGRCCSAYSDSPSTGCPSRCGRSPTRSSSASDSRSPPSRSWRPAKRSRRSALRGPVPSRSWRPSSRRRSLSRCWPSRSPRRRPRPGTRAVRTRPNGGRGR